MEQAYTEFLPWLNNATFAVAVCALLLLFVLGSLSVFIYRIFNKLDEILKIVRSLADDYKNNNDISDKTFELINKLIGKA